MAKCIFFIHGAGQGAHNEDEALAVNLQEVLGPLYDVRYPKMPNEGRPEYTAWKNQITKEFAALDGEVILVGHSLGASILLKYMSEEKMAQLVTGLFLIAPPYWGADDWRVSEYELQPDFASKLPKDLALFFYHSRDDETVPFAHLALYKDQLPQATIRKFDDRGHQFNSELSEVARDIKGLSTAS